MLFSTDTAKVQQQQQQFYVILPLAKLLVVHNDKYLRKPIILRGGLAIFLVTLASQGIPDECFFV